MSKYTNKDADRIPGLPKQNTDKFIKERVKKPTIETLKKELDELKDKLESVTIIFEDNNIEDIKDDLNSKLSEFNGILDIMSTKLEDMKREITFIKKYLSIGE